MVLPKSREARIAVISDLQDPTWWESRHVRDERLGRDYRLPGYMPILSALRDAQPDLVILAGDTTPQLPPSKQMHPSTIIGQGRALAALVTHIARTLPTADVYVLPGSHETVPGMVYAEELLKRTSLAQRVQIIHTPQVIPEDVKGIRFPLAFFPGSTTHPQPYGEIGYHLEQQGMTGIPSLHQTLRSPEGFPLPLAPCFASSANLEARIQNAADEARVLRYDAQDEHANAYDPSRMLLISHVPPRDAPGGIDEADVYIRRDDHALLHKRLAFLMIPAAQIDMLPPADRAAARQHLDAEGWVRMKKPAGLPGLRRIIEAYQPLGVVSGHIEEAGGRAYTHTREPIPPGTLTSSLEVNASGRERHAHTLYILTLREDPRGLSIAYELHRVSQVGHYTLPRIESSPGYSLLHSRSSPRGILLSSPASSQAQQVYLIRN